MLNRKYSLSWQAYSDHLKIMMKDLMMKQDFSDATIITEDKKQIKAHKNILSLCSPFFQDILHKQNTSNPLIYMKGILSSELESIIQFIYLGETTFNEERRDEFLAVAKSLEINQILEAESKANDSNEPESTNANCEVKSVQKEDQEEEQQQTIDNSLDGEGDVTENKKMAFEGTKYPCTKCTYRATQRSHLYVHIRSLHEGIKYPCNQCVYRASDQSSLKKHIQRKHDGIKYPCNYCDYNATEKCSLTKHIKNKHEGIKYPCNECEYRATLQSNLKKHIDTKHNKRSSLDFNR